jgi:serine/threonine protein kinase
MPHDNHYHYRYYRAPKTALCFDEGATVDVVAVKHDDDEEEEEEEDGFAASSSSSSSAAKQQPAASYYFSDPKKRLCRQQQPFPSFSDPDMVQFLSDKQKNRYNIITVSQETLDDQLVHAQFSLVRKLGAGSFGTAYLCKRVMDEEEETPFFAGGQKKGKAATGTASTSFTALPVDVVMKLPNELMVPDALNHAERDLTKAVCPHKVLLATPGIASAFDRRHKFKNYREEALQAFGEEFSNAEAFLEPACMRSMREHAYCCSYDDGRRRRSGKRRVLVVDPNVGLPLKDLTPSQYMEYMMELQLMRIHPGHHHMHRVLHYVASIPAIISEYADGSLWELRQSCIEQKRPWLNAPSLLSASCDGVSPTRLWTQIACQMTSAMDYMRTFSPLAHLDLKPSNVLYRLDSTTTAAAAASSAPPSIQCMLSDYGLCMPKTGRIPVCPYGTEYGECFYGTPIYNPDPDTKGAIWTSGAATWQEMSYFQFFATLMDMLLFQKKETPSQMQQQIMQQTKKTTKKRYHYHYYFISKPDTIDRILQTAFTDEYCERGELYALYQRLKQNDTEGGVKGRRTPLSELLHVFVKDSLPSMLTWSFDLFRTRIREAYEIVCRDDPTKLRIEVACEQARVRSLVYERCLDDEWE